MASGESLFSLETIIILNAFISASLATKYEKIGSGPKITFFDDLFIFLLTGWDDNVPKHEKKH